ncbi:MAG: hypothetical protein PWP08_628 [Methanofollis sp.]|nr:hypothetical protein [Methanofollis sp.]
MNSPGELLNACSEASSTGVSPPGERTAYAHGSALSGTSPSLQILPEIRIVFLRQTKPGQYGEKDILVSGYEEQA